MPVDNSGVHVQNHGESFKDIMHPGLIFAAINILTYMMFWYDKHCARSGKWRVSEAALLGICMLGGSPTGFFAMKILRHKTRKSSFRFRYWLVVTVQIIGIFYIVTHPDLRATTLAMLGYGTPETKTPGTP